MRHVLAITICLGSAVAPAMACLNDRETVKLENEFRSSYVSSAEPGSSDVDMRNDPQRITEWNMPGIAAGLLGAALVAGAFVISRRRFG